MTRSSNDSRDGIVVTPGIVSADTRSIDVEALTAKPTDLPSIVALVERVDAIDAEVKLLLNLETAVRVFADGGSITPVREALDALDERRSADD